MVILLNPYQQRSNNLFQHVHIDSFCRDNNIYFYNKFIQALRSEYTNIGNDNLALNLFRRLRIPQLLNKVKLIKYLNFDNPNCLAAYKAAILKHALVACDGWYFWNEETVQKYRSHYQYLFSPKVDKEYLHQKYLTKLSPTAVTLGVHIRRGDYLHHENGRYFYSDAQYFTILQSLIARLGPDTSIIVFTNDNALNQRQYQDKFESISFSQEPIRGDHYLMSQCDYLVGPPSSFTMWACYMGEVKLHHVYDPAQAIDLRDFAGYLQVSAGRWSQGY